MFSKLLPIILSKLKSLHVVIVEPERILTGERRKIKFHLKVNSCSLYFIFLVFVRWRQSAKVFGVMKKHFTNVQHYISAKIHGYPWNDLRSGPKMKLFFNIEWPWMSKKSLIVPIFSHLFTKRFRAAIYGKNCLYPE